VSAAAYTRVRAEPNNLWKDLMITAMAVTVVTLLISYRYQKVKSNKEMQLLQQRMNTLHSLHDEWSKMDERCVQRDI
jgi:hypothetical protein